MVTIDDVARHAGVSVSTVSYALSGKRAISDATRERIEQSVAKLGYQPNASARALASKRVSALALVAPLRPDNNVPVMMQFVASVATAARERQHDLLLITDEEGDAGVERLRHAAVVDAVIVMDVQADDARLPLLRRLEMPSVIIGQPDEMAGLSCVDLDLRAAAAVLLDQLVEHGHRNVAMLGSPAAVYARGSTYAVRFRDGFEAGCRRRGLIGRFQPMEQHYDGIADALDAVLAGDTTALVVHNEGALAGVLSALDRRGVRVPEDLSVVALCPDDIAMSLQVPLTNVAIPANEVGRLAVETALELLDHRGGAGTRLLAPELTPRLSVAAPRPVPSRETRS